MHSRQGQPPARAAEPQVKSGDQVEVLTSQSQKPQAEWMQFLATAKARTRLRAALRREQQPVIDKGREILEESLARNGVPLNNEIITKLLGNFHLQTRDDLYLAVGNDDIQLDEYFANLARKNARFVFPRWLRLGYGSKDKQSGESATAAPRPPINTKETYELRYDDHESNFRLADCCNPIPGDDVMGFIDDDGEVVVHALNCPRASVLKASYGPRILSTRWAVSDGQVLGHCADRRYRPSGHIAGTDTDDIDPHGDRHTQT